MLEADGLVGKGQRPALPRLCSLPRHPSVGVKRVIRKFGQLSFCAGSGGCWSRSACGATGRDEASTLQVGGSGNPANRRGDTR
jgi:hypothetical protein